MEYATPQKLPDGRYFLKITGARHQVNGLILQDSLASKSVNFKTSSNIFSEIDEQVLAQAKLSKQEWFGKELLDDTIVAAYQESVTDGVLGASLATVKGQVVTLAFDTRKNPVELQDVQPETSCDVVLELSGLWFLKKSFGPIWRILQVRVRAAPKAPELPKEYLFADEPVDEDDDDPADYLD
jgi:hypothetical protein